MKQNASHRFFDKQAESHLMQDALHCKNIHLPLALGNYCTLLGSRISDSARLAKNHVGCLMHPACTIVIYLRLRVGDTFFVSIFTSFFMSLIL